MNVAANGETSVTNNVAVSGGGETNTANDTFQLVTTVLQPDLTITKDASPSTFALGQNGVTYNLQASNTGSAPSTGTVTVTDTLDSNLTYVSSAGTGWSCGVAAQVVTCTSTTAIATGGNAAVIVVTANVKSNGETSVTNNVSVSGGGETNTANDTFQLVTTVLQPDLTITKDASPSTFALGQNGVTYNLRASNTGSAPSTGTVTVTDTLDSNLTYVSATGTGWSCGVARRWLPALRRLLLPLAAMRR